MMSGWHPDGARTASGWLWVVSGRLLGLGLVLVTSESECMAHPGQESNLDTVIHPSTNWAQRRLTSLIKTNVLPLRQTFFMPAYLGCHGKEAKQV